MQSINPVSDLRNYSTLLKQITPGNPMILTNNGRGKYSIQDYSDYEKTQSTIELLNELAQGMSFNSTDECFSLNDFKKKYGID